MNYSKMSDHQINVLVAKALDGHAEDIFPLQRRLQVFDPCKSWADAGPIIQGYQISLDAIYEGGPRWLSFAGEDAEFRDVDANPLRAAMIVFLMMQDAENANS